MNDESFIGYAWVNKMPGDTAQNTLNIRGIYYAPTPCHKASIQPGISIDPEICVYELVVEQTDDQCAEVMTWIEVEPYEEEYNGTCATASIMISDGLSVDLPIQIAS